MTVTIASTQTQQHAELLSQLILLRKHDSLALDNLTFLRQVVTTLQGFCDHVWGMLVVCDHGFLNHASWGLSSEREKQLLRGIKEGPGSKTGLPFVSFTLSVAQEVKGYLLLAPLKKPETLLTPDFVPSLTVLLEMLLQEQFCHQAHRLAHEEVNAQLRQEKERLETVHAITLELTATLNLDDILRRALELISINLGVKRGSIMLRDLASRTLACRAILVEKGKAQIDNIPLRFSNGDGLANWVARHQEAVRIADVRQDRRWVIEPGRADDVRSVVVVPIMTSDTFLGVLNLSSPKINYFSDAQTRLLKTIANEVAIALNNAQLYNYINEMAWRQGELLEQQREETSKNSAILQSLGEGVIVLDPAQCIALFNPAAERMLSIVGREVLQKPLVALASQGQTEKERERFWLFYSGLQTGLQEARKQQGIYSLALDLPNPTQTLAIHLSQVIGHDGQNYGDVAVLRDITREIQADRAKRDFISHVSHELRTPLTAVRGYIDLLLMGAAGELSDQQTNFLQVAKTNTSRLMDLINDILDISRIESGKITLNITQVNLTKAINDSVQSLRLEIERKNLNLELEIAEAIPPLEADEKRLNQVMLNILSNAVKYSYPQGHITIRAFCNADQKIQVEVADTGVGIAPEQIEKLFLPFYRAENPLKEVVGGTGLGLTIVKSLVEQHEGELWVTSEVGHGSTFHFTLPFHQPKPGKRIEVKGLRL